jgi:type III restriction enzyme
MAGFHFEKNLQHQSQAVESVLAVFDGLETKEAIGTQKQYLNPVLDKDIGFRYVQNIGSLQESNNIERKVNGRSNIIDIMMETGTGKTYTYAKTIFELNKNFGIFKFVVVVPTLSIKAGTINFLKSESSREHFREQYGKMLHLHIVESQKGGKGKKSYLPSAVNSFVKAESFAKNTLQVLIINAGMINSDTMQKQFDQNLLDAYCIPFDAISAVRPFVIIDEPHKFSQSNTTWANIQKMNPQFVLRYGATFPEYENLVYTLSAVDSFNRNLVKGVRGHIIEFEDGKNCTVRLLNSDGTEATFEYNDGEKKKSFALQKKESLEKIHSAMEGLFIENLNRSTVVLSNGLELKKGDTINPYSYAETLQETMIQKAIRSHFALEKEFLQREVKIKPLTLFFIDNIEEYRKADGSLKKTVEKYIRAEAEALLKNETDEFYRQYLEKTLENIAKTHGGYFSKDNSEKDEEIEKEVLEILHDKEAMLDLDNPRRFIFSKWTLREGWDNPNVFQICKLRRSGSDISKLQEVGRGLRLPVNEYGNRVKDEQFFLNYFVDFTENDFIDKLKDEINQKSGVISYEDVRKKLDNELIEKICKEYDLKPLTLQVELSKKEIIDDDLNFINEGYSYIKGEYGRIFNQNDKIKDSKDNKKKIKIRTEKYSELKELWEKINQKVILEYKIENEEKFQDLFVDFLGQLKNDFVESGLKEKRVKIETENGKASANEEPSIFENTVTKICTMKYSDFLRQLSQSLKINIATLHASFAKAHIDINQYLNVSTIRTINGEFKTYLMQNAIDAFGIEYQKVRSTVHPTKFTNAKGEVLKYADCSSGDIGRSPSDEKVADNYFLEELWYDSDLEKENIKANIKEVVVFTKIPKNSIRIPVAGGGSYSPDFAYVLDFKDGRKKLSFIVETKPEKDNLRSNEKQNIRYAEAFFGDSVKIKFETQFEKKKMVNLITKAWSKGEETNINESL